MNNMLRDVDPDISLIFNVSCSALLHQLKVFPLLSFMSDVKELETVTSIVSGIWPTLWNSWFRYSKKIFVNLVG